VYDIHVSVTFRGARSVARRRAPDAADRLGRRDGDDDDDDVVGFVVGFTACVQQGVELRADRHHAMAVRDVLRDVGVRIRVRGCRVRRGGAGD